MNKKGMRIFGFFAVMLLFTVAIALILGYLFSDDSGNVAVIPIEGEIGSGSSVFSNTVSSEKIVSDIEDAGLNPAIEAVVFRIDSPGGTPVASKEIANAIDWLEKPTVCWMRETAASGAYWIASYCDVIVADEYTITGSVGVVGSYLEFSGLMDDYNISYVRLVSGENKDMGSPFREPTKEEVTKLQAMIDKIQKGFVKDVMENRNLSEDTMKYVEKSGIMLGSEAYEIGLIDVLGGKEQVTDIVKNMTGLETVTYELYEPEFSFGELMAGFFGKSMAEHMAENEFKISAR